MTQFDYEGRLKRLRAIPGVDAVALVPGMNMRYFTGITYFSSERIILAIYTPDACAWVVPLLESQTLHNRPDLNAEIFTWNDEEGPLAAVTAALESLKLSGKTLGVDGQTMRFYEQEWIGQAMPSLKLKGVELDLLRIRAIKTPEELELMQRAMNISERALDSLLSDLRPEMTEKEIAKALNDLQFAYGAEDLAFDTLIQTGPNSSNPHGNTTDRALDFDEFLLIDFGCKVGGYYSDITRTFVLGDPTPEMQRIYDTVKAANEAAIAAAGPGVAAGLVDRAARRVIEEAGYGPYFTHRTGHGLGMDGQRSMPQIAGNITYLLEPGMTFTIEPGIYLPGVGGVRIEDNVLITDSGLEVMTHFRKSLEI